MTQARYLIKGGILFLAPNMRHFRTSICITISTFTSVHLSAPSHPVTLTYKFLQSYYKMMLIKVTWHVLRVKNMHSGPSSDPCGPLVKAKPSIVDYFIREGES